MPNILTSATKVVLLLMALTVCAALFMGKITQDVFSTLAAMVFGAYFGNKNPTDTGNSQTTSTSTTTVVPVV